MWIVSEALRLSLVAMIVAVPVKESEEDESIVITEEFYSPRYLKYAGDHDIVNILVPFHAINLEDEDGFYILDISAVYVKFIFFVKADITLEGKRIDKGLFILKDGNAIKLLDNGRDAASAANINHLVFFGASNGIYVYENGITKKYGSIRDSIIGIVKPQLKDCIYILTEDNEVYNVTEAGNKKEKIGSIVKAEQIVLDDLDNLYFSDNKQVQVVTVEGVKMITGLPETPSSITLLKPPFELDEGVPVIVNNNTFMVYPNGTSENVSIQFEPKTRFTAYGTEAGVILYYARDKKIYEYNRLSESFARNFKNIDALRSNTFSVRIMLLFLIFVIIFYYLLTRKNINMTQKVGRNIKNMMSHRDFYRKANMEKKILINSVQSKKSNDIKYIDTTLFQRPELDIIKIGCE